MFQQRHFEAIAEMMQGLKPTPSQGSDMLWQWNDTRKELVRLFLRSNPRFDVGRFERACEPGANVRADRRAADRIDGYDRDDLGESPDF